MEDYRTVKLSRRERQIMDIIYQHGQMSVADVLENLPDAPSYSTVRALLRILEEKGHLTHQKMDLATSTVRRNRAIRRDSLRSSKLSRPSSINRSKKRSQH